MTTDPQHLLPAYTPFYKTRKFWLILASLFFLVNILILISAPGVDGNTIFFLNEFAFAAGSGLYVLSLGIFNSQLSTSSMISLLYLIMAVFMLKKVCSSKKILWSALLFFHIFISCLILIGIYLYLQGTAPF